MRNSIFVAAVAFAVLSVGGIRAAEPTEPYTLSKPFTHENLTVYLVHGKEATPGQKFLTLSEALEQKKIVVHETKNVNQLAVENVSDDIIFIQAGDIVKGGQQDRVLGTDLIVSAKSGKVALPSFCVERGRWQQRGGEEVSKFAKCDNVAYSNGLRNAILQKRDQSEVWAQVKAQQMKLENNAGSPVQSAESPTSLQLTLENKKVQENVDKYIAVLTEAVAADKDALGCVIVVNGRVESADVYGSAALFAKMFPRLLKGGAAAAFAEWSKDKKWEPAKGAAVAAFVNDATKADKEETHDATKRTRVTTSETAKNVRVETVDREQEGRIVHRTCIAR